MLLIFTTFLKAAPNYELKQHNYYRKRLVEEYFHVRKRVQKLIENNKLHGISLTSDIWSNTVESFFRFVLNEDFKHYVFVFTIYLSKYYLPNQTWYIYNYEWKSYLMLQIFSLTAHFVSDVYRLYKLVLHAQHMSKKRHTAEHVQEII